MRKENAILHTNCAQTYLKLKQYSDAYTYSSECIQLDPQNDKGYFRRAKSLRLMLETASTDHGTHMDVAKDYLMSHSLHANIETFCKAIVIAVEHSKLNIYPYFLIMLSETTALSMFRVGTSHTTVIYIIG